MWRRGLRRIDVLERRAAIAEQERQGLRDRLTAFEAIARAAGVHLGSAEPDVVSDVPPSLIAATSAPRPGGLPVVVDLGARRVVAVTGPAGDPREWMPSIAATAFLQPPAGQVASIERAPMPDGLLAAAAIPAGGGQAVRLAEHGRAAELARRPGPAHRRRGKRRHVPDGPYRGALTGGGGLAVRVADTLTAAEARHAAVAAVRAARRNGWAASQTAAIIPVLAAAAGWHAAAIPVRAAIFSGVATAAAAAAAVAISVLPGHPAMPLVRTSPLPAPAAHAHTHAHHHPRARKSAPHVIAARAAVTNGQAASPSGMPARRPQGSAKPERTPSAGVRRPSSPSPPPATPVPPPSPTPSPNPPASGTARECLGVLILNVCITL